MNLEFSVKSKQTDIWWFTRLLQQGMVVFSLIALPGLVYAQEVNPLESDPRATRAGGALFRAQCATCHAPDAKGIQSIDAPDLTTLWALGDRTDASVFASIRSGVPGSIMPPHSFSDTEVWMLVSFLKSIGNASNTASIAGDAGHGAELFAANCITCHRVNGEGGSLGPELSVITAIRSRQALVSSIRNPSAILVNRYRPVSLLTRDNRRIHGTVKSEDAFSIQVMDSEQNLRAFMKADLQQLTHETRSLMPEFAIGILSDSDLDDLLGFLDSQRRNRAN